MYYKLSYNIVDVFNSISFTYRGLTSELQVFITLFVNINKETNFIQALK